MKLPRKQDQHVIPQVYLRQFGYQTNGGQWKISVLKRDEKFTRQKSIGSFTAVTNIFDIDSEDPNIPRMFENLNKAFEDYYPTIITKLDENGALDEKSFAFLLQFIANLIVRSDHWRDWVLEMLERENKVGFLRAIVGHLCKDINEFRELDTQPHFRNLVDSPPKDSLNRALLYFLDHLMQRLWHFEIVIIRAQVDKPWFTSTNPVVVHNRVEELNIMNGNSELYFPLSPNYLAYLHYPGSEDKDNPLRHYQNNSITESSDEQNIALQRTIMQNPSDYLIIAGEFDYKIIGDDKVEGGEQK